MEEPAKEAYKACEADVWRKKRPMLTRGQVREDWNWPPDWAVNLGKVKCNFDRVVKANCEENRFKKWCKKPVRSRVYKVFKEFAWHYPSGRKWGGTKEPLDEGEGVEWKSWLKTQHSKTEIMASGPIRLWEIDRGKMETVTDFIFLG